MKGWAPSCKCNDGNPMPCKVLDPFAGAGTTGLAALRHGRDAVLIELNSEYCKIMEEALGALSRRNPASTAPGFLWRGADLRLPNWEKPVWRAPFG